MNRIARCLILAVLTSKIVFAQPAKKEFNSLLWRISGNGLSTPSYVYGTMHLTDKRLFDFSDSLYYFLEHSDGFAAEVDMGALMPEIISELNGEKDNTRLIKSLVRPEWLAPYREVLEKKLAKKIDNITIRDLQKAKSKFGNQLLRSGEMSTIMDVYLFDIARRQGKWVGGIEDFEDQRKKAGIEDEIMSMIGEITEDTKEVNKKLDWMIKTYLSQELDAIDLTNELWKGAEQNILVRRNNKMARRMDSIMQLRTCVFAVGAAHIPGDSGVIKLLRNRGFTVEPVYSSRKIEAGKYVYTSKEIPWVNTEIKDNWYSLFMPGKSEELAMAKNNSSLAARFYYDMTRMNAYFTFYFPLSPDRIYNNDSIYKNLASNFAKEGKLVSEKSITLNGTPGKEFLIKSSESDLRLQAFLPSSAIVLNMMASYKYDSLSGNDAGRFFESFHILKPAPVLVNTSSWQTYSFPQQAFSIKFPLQYQEQKRNLSLDTAWRTHVYMAMDNAETLSCWMIIMDAKSGYYSDSDSAYFESMKQGFLKRFKNSAIESSKREDFQGFPSYRVAVKVKYENDLLQLNARIVNRGNRRYYFYAIFPDDGKGKEKADSFLYSFNFLPIESSSWSYQSSPVKDLSVWSPSSLHYQAGKDSTKKTAGYILYDSVSPATTLINKEYLSPYSWWKSDSAFFSQQAHRFLTENDDSIRDYKMITDGKVPQADFIVVPKDNHNLKKVRLLLNGDTLYSVFTFLPPGLILTANYLKLFNNIEVTQLRPPGYHLTKKTNAILRDIASGDSASFEEAVSSLRDAEFETSDLPLLQKALLQPYRDFYTGDPGVHQELIKKITGIDDGSTFTFIKNNYPSLKDSTEKLQSSFLYLLLVLKTKEAYVLFKDFITQKIPAGDKKTTLQYALTDSLELTASIFPDMLRLSADTGFIKILPFIANKLLDSGLVSIEAIESYKKNFYALTEREIKRIRLEAQDYDYRGNTLIKFLAHFREPAVYQLLHQFLSLTGVSIKNNAAIALIKNGQNADIKELETIAKDNFYRLELYEGLKELKQEKLFPVKYYTQKLFAQSDVCRAASDDYDADSVLFIIEKTALFKGRQEKFYLFKVVYNYEDGDAESYLGIAGPYPKLPGKIIARSDVSGVFREETYDLKKVNAQLKEYLKEQEDYLNEENE